MLIAVGQSQRGRVAKRGSIGPAAGPSGVSGSQCGIRVALNIRIATGEPVRAAAAARLAIDPRFATAALRLANGDELYAIVRPALAAEPWSVWSQRFTDARLMHER